MNHTQNRRVPPPQQGLGQIKPAVYKNEQHYQSDSTTDHMVCKTYDDGEHIYDQMTDTLDDSRSNHYTGLNSEMDGVIKNINSRLENLETKHDHLSAKFEDSQRRIVSEISQLKDMIGSLQSLMTDSLAKFQKMSAHTEQRVHELGVNLSQEIFQVGQEVMARIKEKTEVDAARDTWLALLEAESETNVSKESKKQSKKHSLPSL